MKGGCRASCVEVLTLDLLAVLEVRVRQILAALEGLNVTFSP